jgi:tetratricopeptide (TPR) repeat protein
MTAADDKSRQALVDNLAASIYKQGEQANAKQDYRAAADHFLRVKQVAPTSAIRAAAEYDAGAALIQLQDWTAAAGVLEAFRSAYPDHELNREATKQIAFVYRQNGQTGRAAGEYERVAAESSDPKLRGEALLEAGDLYEQSGSIPAAITAYALRRPVPPSDRHGRADAFQGRQPAQVIARRAEIPRGAAEDRPHRCRGGR